MLPAALEFNRQVDEIYSTYIDSVFGYSKNLEIINKSQRENILDLEKSDPDKANIQFLDSQEMSYSVSGKEMVVSNTALFKSRNRLNGPNWQWAARMFVVTVYELWECEYRKKIGSQKFPPSESLNLPIMGDLRHLRHWIIHCKSIPDSDIKRLEVINWCVENEELQFNFNRVCEIVNELRSALNGI